MISFLWEQLRALLIFDRASVQVLPHVTSFSHIPTYSPRPLFTHGSSLGLNDIFSLGIPLKTPALVRCSWSYASKTYFPSRSSRGISFWGDVNIGCDAGDQRVLGLRDRVLLRRPLLCFRRDAERVSDASPREPRGSPSGGRLSGPFAVALPTGTSGLAPDDFVFGKVLCCAETQMKTKVCWEHRHCALLPTKGSPKHMGFLSSSGMRRSRLREKHNQKAENKIKNLLKEASLNHVLSVYLWAVCIICFLSCSSSRIRPNAQTSLLLSAPCPWSWHYHGGRHSASPRWSLFNLKIRGAVIWMWCSWWHGAYYCGRPS